MQFTALHILQCSIAQCNMTLSAQYV